MDESIEIDGFRNMARGFRIAGKLVDAVPYGSGHINDTYAATFEAAGATRRYVLQRINHDLFQNVDALMENVMRVTGHVRAKLAETPDADPDRETLTIVPTVDDNAFLRTPEGDFWRAYVFIEDARTRDVLTDPSQAYEAAKAFGRFQRFLADLPAPTLHETIPNFHHTPMRLAALERAVAEDSRNRAQACLADIDFALSRRAITDKVTTALETGALPWRITHNDTKVNNVLLDNRTQRAICVIDLDTVMPGSVLYDFGDMVRTFTATAEEDEQDLTKVDVNLDIFRQQARGYLEATGDILTPAEIDDLVFAGKLITLTIGIRFLTDHLAGDTYFKIHRPGHNLDRARTQFKMVRHIEDYNDTMQAIVRDYA